MFDKVLKYVSNKDHEIHLNYQLIPFGKLKLGMQSLSYVGPSTWNKLANSIKVALITSLNCF